LNSDICRIRFPFDTSANVISGNAYWAVIRTDYTRGDSQTNLNYLQLFGDPATVLLPYPDGPAKFFNANTGGWALSNSTNTIDQQLGGTGASNFYLRTFIEANDSPVVMPTGYDQKCLLSYASTTKRGFFREYHQRGYRMSMAFHYTWSYYNNGGLVGAQGTDMSAANNVLAVAYSSAINMGCFVPPVPCLVWIYKYTGINGSHMAGAGSISCLKWPVQLFDETNNGLSLTNGPGAWVVMGPILVEFGCHTDHSAGSTFGNLYLAGIEF
jgi:hypothetical protein